MQFPTEGWFTTNRYSYYLEVRCKEDDAKKGKKLGFY